MELKDVTPDDVLSVYSGVDGKCCCGCAGKHTTNPMYRALRSEERGYEVDEDECSLRTVKTILNKIKKATDVENGGDYFSFATNGGERYAGHGRYKRTPGRLYVVYLKPSDEEIEVNRRRRADAKLKQIVDEANKKAEALEALKGAGI